MDFYLLCGNKIWSFDAISEIFFCHTLCSMAEYYFNNGFYDQICCLGLFFGNISICKPLSCLFLRFWLLPKFYWYEACWNIHSAYFYLLRSIFSASINMISSVQSLWTLSAAFPVLLPVSALWFSAKQWFLIY